MEGYHHQDDDYYYQGDEDARGDSIEVWSDTDYDEGNNEVYPAYPYQGSSAPQQQVWSCCEPEASSGYSSDEEQSQPDCPCQGASSSGSDDVSRSSESTGSRTQSEWETDCGSDSVASRRSGITYPGSTDQTDSCRCSGDDEASSSSWETATVESSSSWETATTCSCEAAEAACQSCASAEIQRWDDDDPPENPDSSPAKKWMSHPFSEGGGSGDLAPRLPSMSLPRAPIQRRGRPPPSFRRWKMMNSSGEGRRPEAEKTKVPEQKKAHGPRTRSKPISAPPNPIAAQSQKPARSKPRPKRRRVRWAPLRRINGKRRLQAP